jgi:Na+/melibiose symporter-like transporter
MHFFAKVGFAANDAVTSLKLVEKGYEQEELAIVFLIDFPIQIIGAWLAAKVSRGEKPLWPWITAFWPRLGLAFVATLIVYYFPKPITHGFFTFLIFHTVVSNFAT